MSLTMLNLLIDLSARWFYNIISSTLRERMTSIKEAKTNAVEYLTVNLKPVCFSVQLALISTFHLHMHFFPSITLVSVMDLRQTFLTQWEDFQRYQQAMG